MQEYQDKPKRKRESRNPYLFLVAGIVIGIIITAIALALTFFGFSSDATSQSEVVAITEIVVAPPQPTVAPFNAQAVQPTPIANRIQAAAISGNSRTLAYVSVENGNSHIYLNELRVERNLTGNQYELYESYGYYNDVLFSPDGSKLVATIDDGTAVLFDVETKTLVEQYAQIGGAAFTPDGNTLVLVGRNNGIRVLDVSTNTPELIANRIAEETSYTIGGVAINQNDDLAIGINDRVEIFNWQNLAQAPQVLTPNNGFVQDLAFHPTQENILAMAFSGTNPQNGSIQIYDTSNSSRTHYDFGTRVYALAFSPEGDWLAVAGGESGYGESRLIAFRWDNESIIPPDAETFYQPLVFDGHEHTIFDVAFTPEGYLLSAGWDGSVRLWDLISEQNAISVYYP